VISVLAAMARARRGLARRLSRTRAAEVAIGAAVTGVVVLPAFLGFAEPVRRGAAAVAWLKSIAGVLLCGALLALGNWIYTLCTIQWAQTGLPAMPPMVVRPGGGELPLGAAGAAAPINSGGAQAARAPKPATSWLASDEYRD
jgi:hypothetical protein